MALTEFAETGPGNQWPPWSEQNRIRSYRDYWRWFVGQHEALERLNRVPIHWFRRVSQVWSEMLFASPPRLSYEGEMGVGEWVEAQEPALMSVAADCALDVSRYGTGIMRVEPGVRGGVVFAAEYPGWFVPVMEAASSSLMIGEVFGYPYRQAKPMLTNERPGEGHLQEGLADRIALWMHDYRSGEIRRSDFRYEGLRIGEAVSESRVVESGVFTPRTVAIPNGPSSSDGFGDSDYVAIAPLVAEMERRGGSVARVLDRHSDPHLAVPEGALDRGAGTQAIMSETDGMIFPVAEDQSPPQYVVWDGQLSPAFEQIQVLQDLLFAFSGLSAAMFSGRKNLGTIESGVALRSRYLATHLKLESLRRRFERGIRALLDGAARIPGGPAFDPMLLRFEWEDIFPADDRVMTAALDGGAGPMNPTGAAGRTDA